MAWSSGAICSVISAPKWAVRKSTGMGWLLRPYGLWMRGDRSFGRGAPPLVSPLHHRQAAGPKPLEKTQLLRWPKPRRAQATPSCPRRCLPPVGHCARTRSPQPAEGSAPSAPWQAAAMGQATASGGARRGARSASAPAAFPACCRYALPERIYWLRTGGAGAIWRSGGWRGSSA